MKFVFDVARFLADCGGIGAAPSSIGKERTCGYGWVKRRRMSSDDIAELKGLNPNIDLNAYVVVRTDE